jgi:hypothetical protein
MRERAVLLLASIDQGQIALDTWLPPTHSQMREKQRVAFLATSIDFRPTLRGATTEQPKLGKALKAALLTIRCREKERALGSWIV